jgi:hypothetical protein
MTPLLYPLAGIAAMVLGFALLMLILVAASVLLGVGAVGLLTAIGGMCVSLVTGQEMEPWVTTVAIGSCVSAMFGVIGLDDGA